jgi:DNA-binding NarL/FixJ family response regulator
MKGSEADPPAKSRTGRRRRVFLVDDHPLVREWLAGLIRPQPDLELCGTADDAASALASLAQIRADVVVVDLSLEGNSGLDLIRDLRAFQPQAKVLVLSMHEEAHYAERALRAGARGYIMKRESTDRIIDAIRQVLQGKVYASEALMARIAERFVAGSAAAVAGEVDALSDRELEVFRLLGHGYQTREVAARMKAGMKSVQVYCGRIKAKLNLSNASELRREAVRWIEAGQRR